MSEAKKAIERWSRDDLANALVNCIERLVELEELSVDLEIKQVPVYWSNSGTDVRDA